MVIITVSFFPFIFLEKERKLRLLYEIKNEELGSEVMVQCKTILTCASSLVVFILQHSTVVFPITLERF